MYEAHDYARAAMTNPEMGEHYEREAARWVRLPGGFCTMIGMILAGSTPQGCYAHLPDLL